MRTKYRKGDLVRSGKSLKFMKKAGLVLSKHHNYVNTYNILVDGVIISLHVKFMELINESR